MVNVAALVSGGKDSCFNMMKCVEKGHRIVAIVNLYSNRDDDEINSYMFQTVGCRVVELIARAMGVPLFRDPIDGTAICFDQLEYSETRGDEVESMYRLLARAKAQVPFEGVSVGAISSRYQLERVQHVCRRIGAEPLAYLWNRPQVELLDEMISSGLSAILVKVSSFGLSPRKHLGRTLGQVRDHLVWLSDKFGGNACGEGGEYETITLSCPLFGGKRITLVDTHVVFPPDLPVESDVAYLRIVEASLG